MIWIDNGAGYNTFKTIAEYRRLVRPIRIDWLAQSPDFKFIENLWRIIKVEVSAKRQQIRLLESMREVIKEE